jgi:hypothetical protein
MTIVDHEAIGELKLTPTDLDRPVLAISGILDLERARILGIVLPFERHSLSRNKEVVLKLRGTLSKIDDITSQRSTVITQAVCDLLAVNACDWDTTAQSELLEVLGDLPVVFSMLYEAVRVVGLYIATVTVHKARDDGKTCFLIGLHIDSRYTTALVVEQTKISKTSHDGVCVITDSLSSACNTVFYAVVILRIARDVSSDHRPCWMFAVRSQMKSTRPTGPRTIQSVDIRLQPDRHRPVQSVRTYPGVALWTVAKPQAQIVWIDRNCRIDGYIRPFETKRSPIQPQMDPFNFLGAHVLIFFDGHRVFIPIADNQGINEVIMVATQDLVGKSCLFICLETA